MTFPGDAPKRAEEWPELPHVEENDPRAKVKEILYQAQVDVFKADRLLKIELEKVTETNRLDRQKQDEDIPLDRKKSMLAWQDEQRKTVTAQEQELEKAVHAAYIEVAKGQIERMQTRADFVQKAAAAIVTLYTGVLTLIFAVEKNPLPARGVVPAIFLGMAIVFSATYFAFVTRPEDLRHPKPSSVLSQKQRRRLDRFILWSRAPALQRRHFLQLSIICLGAGVMFLPAPFLKIPNWIVFLLAVFAFYEALVFTGIIWIIELLLSKSREKESNGSGAQMNTIE